MTPDQWRSAYLSTRKIPIVKSLVRMAVPMMDFELDGLTYHIHPFENYAERRMFLDAAYLEPVSLGKLEDLVRGTDTVVIDAGANVGMFTMPLARALGPKGRVIGFEPNPTLANRLLNNLKLNGLAEKVDVRQLALSSDHGEGTLTFHRKNTGASSLDMPRMPGKSITVKTVPLSGVLEELRGKRVVMKMDIEGVEDRALWPVLSGDPSILPSHILIETSHANKWAHDIPARLHELGYHDAYSGEENTLFSRTEAAA